MTPSVSLVVCTYRRPRQLGLVLDSLAALERPPGLTWEVVVVDNAPGGPSAEVARSRAGSLPLRYVEEPRLGAASARNRGVIEARHELLAYLDDDVVADPGWLAGVLAAWEAHPEVGFFGGRVLPNWDRPQPRWYDGRLPILKDIVPSFDLGEVSRPLSRAGELPLGANMVFRRSLCPPLEFRLDLGVTGAARLSNEENEMFLSLLNAGVAGRYLAEARVYHEVDPDRLHLRYLVRWGFGYGRSQARIEGPPTAAGLCWQVMRAAGHGALLGPALLRRRPPAAASHLAEATVSTGRVVEGLRRRFGSPPG